MSLVEWRSIALPVYEYRCGGGHQYEKTEGFDAPTRHACPTCGSRAKRMISLPAVIFKGSGFYHTDNRKESSANGRSSTPAESSTATPSKSSDDHGHSHDGGGHSHDTPSASSPKVEAAATE
jgi:putative FmdB family regulatory protein